MTTKKAAHEAEMTFEQAMARLEALVNEMEGGEAGLDRMMGDFEEGTALVKLCTAKLNEIERRIEILAKKEDGSVVAEPFEAAAADEGAPVAGKP